jgi:hypothetical protein
MLLSSSPSLSFNDAFSMTKFIASTGKISVKDESEGYEGKA